MSETLTIPVGGMNCGHCVKSITERLSGLPGVENVDVSLETGLARVSGKNLAAATLRAAIEELGFDAGEAR